jgi:hypothetical protein
LASLLLASISVSPNAKNPATVVAGAEAYPQRGLGLGDGFTPHEPQTNFGRHDEPAAISTASTSVSKVIGEEHDAGQLRALKLALSSTLMDRFPPKCNGKGASGTAALEPTPTFTGAG